MAEPSVWVARLRLVALGISQSAHFASMYALRVFVVLTAGTDGAVPRGAAWPLVSALFMLPAIFFVPIYGALGNSLPKRTALVGAAGYGVAVFAGFTLLGHGWLWCVALAAVGSALFTPTRFALLPAAARETALPLPRVVSWIEASAVLSIVGGMVLGGKLVAWHWLDLGVDSPALEQVPFALALLTALSVVCLAGALLAWFPTDVRRPEAARAALQGFFTDAVRLLASQGSGLSLAGIAYLRGVVTVAAGAFIAVALEHDGDSGSGAALVLLIRIALLSLLGAGIGSLLASVVSDVRRSLGLVPWGALGLAVALVGVTALGSAPAWLCVLVGALGGIVNVPLLTAFQQFAPADARGNANAILNTAGFVSMTLLSVLQAGLAATGVLSPTGQLWFAAALAGLGALAAWLALAPCALGRAGHQALSNKSPV